MQVLGLSFKHQCALFVCPSFPVLRRQHLHGIKLFLFIYKRVLFFDWSLIFNFDFFYRRFYNNIVFFFLNWLFKVFGLSRSFIFRNLWFNRWLTLFGLTLLANRLSHRRLIASLVVCGWLYHAVTAFVIRLCPCKRRVAFLIISGRFLSIAAFLVNWLPFGRSSVFSRWFYSLIALLAYWLSHRWLVAPLICWLGSVIAFLVDR